MQYLNKHIDEFLKRTGMSESRTSLLFAMNELIEQVPGFKNLTSDSLGKYLDDIARDLAGETPAPSGSMYERANAPGDDVVHPNISRFMEMSQGEVWNYFQDTFKALRLDMSLDSLGGHPLKIGLHFSQEADVLKHYFGQYLYRLTKGDKAYFLENMSFENIQRVLGVQGNGYNTALQGFSDMCRFLEQCAHNLMLKEGYNVHKYIGHTDLSKADIENIIKAIMPRVNHVRDTKAAQLDLRYKEGSFWLHSGLSQLEQQPQVTKVIRENSTDAMLEFIDKHGIQETVDGVDCRGKTLLIGHTVNSDPQFYRHIAEVYDVIKNLVMFGETKGIMKGDAHTLELEVEYSPYSLNIPETWDPSGCYQLFSAIVTAKKLQILLTQVD